MTGQEIIKAATEVGFCLLRNGAEVYRVEQSVDFICRAYGVAEVHVFAVHSTLFVSISYENEDFSTKIRRTYHIATNFDKVDKLNALSRKICDEKPEYAEIKRLLREIDTAPAYPQWVINLGGLVAALFFCLFFGGNAADAIAAGVIGCLLEVGIFYLDKLENNGFVRNILGAAFSTAMSKFVVMLGLAQKFDAVNIGVLMLLVPGLALTISMRDFLESDYISGIAKLAEALMTAVCIAIGVTVVVLIW